MEFFKNIGQNISIILKDKEWNNEILAEKANLSEKNINKILKGEKILNIKEIEKFSKILNVDKKILLKEDIQTIYPKIDINTKNKDDIEFLNNVIKEIIIMEKMLY